MYGDELVKKGARLERVSLFSVVSEPNQTMRNRDTDLANPGAGHADESRQ